MKRGLSRTMAVLAALLFCAPLAQAYSPGSDLTDPEWESWPDYCKAAFVTSDWGNRSHFAKRISPAELARIIETQNNIFGIPGPHHFCVGMVYLNRSRGATRTEKQRLLNNAIAEIGYSYREMHKNAPMFSFVSAQLGIALHRLGRRIEAFDVWLAGTAAQPKLKDSYLAMAQALLSDDKPNDALGVLLRFDKEKEAPAADAEYFLGHTYFELGRYEEARRHADKAYELGYPFPGLREKLSQVEKKKK